MIVGLLLGAGGASRFGSQKLVAPFRGVPLVRHAANTLLATTDRTIVVIGNAPAALRDALAESGVQVVENPEWRDGLSSSLRRGVASLPPSADAAVIALGDQPAIDPDIVRLLIARWRETG